MKKVIVLYHSQEFMNTHRMAEAIAKGAREAGAQVILWNCNEKRMNIEDYRLFDAVFVGSPDYFSYVAGCLKTFFDDWSLARDKDPRGLENKPVGIFFSHGTRGKVRDPLERLALKLGYQVGSTIESDGAPNETILSKCEQLGEIMVKKIP